MRLQTDKNKYGVNYVQPVEPTDKFSGCLWYDTVTDLLKVWTGTFWRWSGMEPISGGEFGYSVGGSNSVSFVSLVERISFPFAAGVASLVGYNQGGLSSYGGGFFNSTKFAYILGGQEAGAVLSSTINTLQFPFDSGITQFVGNTEASRQSIGSCNSSLFGYGISGVSTNGGTAISYISKLQFSTNAYIQVSAYTLIAAETYGGLNSSTHGFICGGASGTSGPTFYSTIQRMTFSIDTTNSISVGNLRASKRYGGNCNSSLHGFSVGGVSLSYIDRLSFPFDVGAAVTAMSNLPVSSQNDIRITSSPISGFFLGGSNVTTSNIVRIDYPFDSGLQPVVGTLSSTRYSNCTPDNTDFIAQFV